MDRTVRCAVWKLLCCAICISCSSCATPTGRTPVSFTGKTQTPNVELLLSVGRAHESEGKLVEAAETYSQLYDSAADNAEVCHRYGVVLVQIGQVDEGLTYLMEADALADRNIEIKSDLGFAYLQKGDYAMAESFLREALNINPRDVRAINNLALTVGLQGRTAEAFNHYRSVMDEAEAHANVGYIHAQRGETQMAIRRYNEALTMNPALEVAAEGLVQLADLQIQLAKLQKERGLKPEIQLATGTK